MKREPGITPSMLSSNFANLAPQLEELEKLAPAFLHLDIMDGHFVPNITFGPPLVKALRAASSLKFDAHLMITEPEKYIPPFIEAGADYVSFHIEVRPDPREGIALIREKGARPGLVLNPDTPYEKIEPYIDQVDLILVMSVFPGFGGQKFIGDVLPKIEKIRRKLDAIGSEAYLQVDGGINTETAMLCLDAGADLFVAGNSVFGGGDITGAYNELMSALKSRSAG
jgi:ribulose-phosphate 3-epimerase